MIVDGGDVLNDRSDSIAPRKSLGKAELESIEKTITDIIATRIVK